MDGKIKLIIASILKAVDDTRAYEKMGRSLAQTNKYAVNIIGFESKKTPTEKNIYFWPIFNAHRKHLLRFLAPIKFLKICHQVKPQVLIVNTPELLLVSYLYKIIFGTKIIYDVRENYQMNLAFDATYPNWQKPLLKLYLFLTEGLSKHFVSHYFLAERIYLKQLKFISINKTTVIENKTAITSQNIAPRTGIKLKKEGLKFIITGTLGRSYGTVEGIQFFQRISLQLPHSQLYIVGYAADREYKEAILKAGAADDRIHLEINDGPIPHEHIINTIKEADVALLPYELNLNIKYRIPTKIYEYAALQKPMLLPHNDIWANIVDRFDGGMVIDFKEKRGKLIANTLLKKVFYKERNPSDIYWESEAKKLIKVLNGLT